MVDFNITRLEEACKVLHSLKNSVRERIFTAVKEHPGIKVGELYMTLDIQQSEASRHLHILRESGIVQAQREGQTIHYSLSVPTIKIISLVIEQLASFYVPAMASEVACQQSGDSHT